jgi:hypothetical protein
MKKIVIFISAMILAINSNAQQTEDDPSVGGSWRTFGKYQGTEAKNLKPMKGQITINGRVVNVSWCEEDCLTILVKTNDGKMLTIGTKDNAFSVPKDLSGKKIIVEGIDLAKINNDKKSVKKEYQKDIQVAAIGIKVYE